MDSTSWGALFAAIVAIVQVFGNQWGSQQARKHELKLAEIKQEEARLKDEREEEHGDRVGPERREITNKDGDRRDRKE